MRGEKSTSRHLRRLCYAAADLFSLQSHRDPEIAVHARALADFLVREMVDLRALVDSRDAGVSDRELEKARRSLGLEPSQEVVIAGWAASSRILRGFREQKPLKRRRKAARTGSGDPPPTETASASGSPPAATTSTTTATGTPSPSPSPSAPADNQTAPGDDREAPPG